MDATHNTFFGAIRRPQTRRLSAFAITVEGEEKIAHKFSGQKVSEILKQKKGSIKQAPLASGSPSWSEFSQMTWEQIEAGAGADKPGFKVVRKLLTDKRFDR